MLFGFLQGQERERGQTRSTANKTVNDIVRTFFSFFSFRFFSFLAFLSSRLSLSRPSLLSRFFSLRLLRSRSYESSESEPEDELDSSDLESLDL